MVLSGAAIGGIVFAAAIALTIIIIVIYINTRPDTLPEVVKKTDEIKTPDLSKSPEVQAAIKEELDSAIILNTKELIKLDTSANDTAARIVIREENIKTINANLTKAKTDQDNAAITELTNMLSAEEKQLAILTDQLVTETAAIEEASKIAAALSLEQERLAQQAAIDKANATKLAADLAAQKALEDKIAADASQNLLQDKYCETCKLYVKGGELCPTISKECRGINENDIKFVCPNEQCPIADYLCPDGSTRFYNYNTFNVDGSPKSNSTCPAPSKNCWDVSPSSMLRDQDSLMIYNDQTCPPKYVCDDGVNSFYKPNMTRVNATTGVSEPYNTNCPTKSKICYADGQSSLTGIPSDYDSYMEYPAKDCMIPEIRCNTDGGIADTERFKFTALGKCPPLTNCKVTTNPDDVTDLSVYDTISCPKPTLQCGNTGISAYSKCAPFTVICPGDDKASVYNSVECPDISTPMLPSNVDAKKTDLTPYLTPFDGDFTPWNRVSQVDKITGNQPAGFFDLDNSGQNKYFCIDENSDPAGGLGMYCFDITQMSTTGEDHTFTLPSFTQSWYKPVDPANKDARKLGSSDFRGLLKLDGTTPAFCAKYDPEDKRPDDPPIKCVVFNKSINKWDTNPLNVQDRGYAISGKLQEKIPKRNDDTQAKINTYSLASRLTSCPDERPTVGTNCPCPIIDQYGWCYDDRIADENKKYFRVINGKRLFYPNKKSFPEGNGMTFNKSDRSLDNCPKVDDYWPNIENGCWAGDNSTQLYFNDGGTLRPVRNKASFPNTGNYSGVNPDTLEKIGNSVDFQYFRKAGEIPFVGSVFKFSSGLYYLEATSDGKSIWRPVPDQDTANQLGVTYSVYNDNHLQLHPIGLPVENRKCLFADGMVIYAPTGGGAPGGTYLIDNNGYARHITDSGTNNLFQADMGALNSSGPDVGGCFVNTANIPHRPVRSVNTAGDGTCGMPDSAALSLTGTGGSYVFSNGKFRLMTASSYGAPKNFKTGAFTAMDRNHPQIANCQLENSSQNVFGNCPYPTGYKFLNIDNSQYYQISKGKAMPIVTHNWWGNKGISNAYDNVPRVNNNTALDILNKCPNPSGRTTL